MEVNSYAFVMGLTFCAALQNLEAMLIETAPPNKLSSCYALLGFSNNGEFSVSLRYSVGEQMTEV